MTAALGDQTMLGDNGPSLYNADGAAYSYDTTDRVNTTGGVDTILPSKGRLTTCLSDWISDVCSADVVTTLGTSTDLVLGDNGTVLLDQTTLNRSEERRVGKEGRSRWSPYH